MTFLWSQGNPFNKKNLTPSSKKVSLSQQLILVYNPLGLQRSSARNACYHSARKEPDTMRLSGMVAQATHSKPGIQTWIIQCKASSCFIKFTRLIINISPPAPCAFLNSWHWNQEQKTNSGNSEKRIQQGQYLCQCLCSTAYQSSAFWLLPVDGSRRGWGNVKP